MVKLEDEKKNFKFPNFSRTIWLQTAILYEKVIIHKEKDGVENYSEQAKVDENKSSTSDSSHGVVSQNIKV